MIRKFGHKVRRWEGPTEVAEMDDGEHASQFVLEWLDVVDDVSDDAGWAGVGLARRRRMFSARSASSTAAERVYAFRSGLRGTSLSMRLSALGVSAERGGLNRPGRRKRVAWCATTTRRCGPQDVPRQGVGPRSALVWTAPPCVSTGAGTWPGAISRGLPRAVPRAGGRGVRSRPLRLCWARRAFVGCAKRGRLLSWH